MADVLAGRAVDSRPVGDPGEGRLSCPVPPAPGRLRRLVPRARQRRGDRGAKDKAASRFLGYLDEVGAGDLAALGVRDVSGFLLRQRGLRRKTIAGMRSCLADFLGFLAAAGRAPRGLAGRLPPHRHVRHESEPHLWTADEIRRVLAVIDRQSAAGKRDYAMILTTARLGLRISDLRQLELGDLDWRAKTITIVQHKTGRPLSLPLLDDVGWAIIDYVRSGRPETACPKVFVKHRHPFDAFGCASSVACRLSRHAARAGIVVPAGPGVRDAFPARRAGRGHDRQRHADAGGIGRAGTRLERHDPGLLPAVRRRTAALLRAGRRRRHRTGRGG